MGRAEQLREMLDKKSGAKPVAAQGAEEEEEEESEEKKMRGALACMSKYFKVYLWMVSGGGVGKTKCEMGRCGGVGAGEGGIERGCNPASSISTIVYRFTALRILKLFCLLMDV